MARFITVEFKVERVAVWCVIVGVLACLHALSQPKQQAQDDRFIVAFELVPEKNFRYTWPYESMKPAPYETVLITVESMPRVRERKHPDQKARPLNPLAHLLINGRNPTPTRQKRQYRIRLQAGRLRFSIAVPEGMEIDQAFRTAKIKVHQVGNDEN